MVFEDTKHTIYTALIDEYKYSSINDWSEFVESLDVGIRFISNDDDEELVNDVYEITDEEKYFLAKIKYGI